MRRIAFGIVLASLYMPAAYADSTKIHRDVYFDGCRQAQRECRWDWGTGSCVRASAKEQRRIFDKLVTSQGDSGGDGGGDGRPVCMVIGPWYTTKRASPLPEYRMVGIAVFDKKTREVESFRWFVKQHAYGGGN